jgi:L-ribulose-5-phosphate 3-epimerase
MKIGLNAGIFPGRPAPAEAIRLAREAGAEGLELNLGEEGPFSLQSSEAELREIRRAAEAEGVELPTIHCGLHWRYPLTDPDEAVRRKGLEVLSRTLEVGATIGARVHLVVPGIVKPEVPYAEAYQRAQDGVARLARKAEAVGLRIGIENVWNRFLLSPLEMARFIDELGTPTVGAYFDVGNILAYGYPQHWIATLGGRIYAVHFKDYRADVPGGAGFVYLFEGDVPWGEIRTALQAVGYDWYVTAELGPYRFQPELTARDTVAKMRIVLGR